MLSIILGNIMLGICVLIQAITMQQKDKKNILIGLIIVNITAIISYLFLKSYSAVIVNFIAIGQVYIKYKFDQKDKKMPLYLQLLFILISILSGIFTLHNLIDVLPIICLVLYTLAIMQSKERNIRLFTCGNIIGWIIFDFYAKAYVGILTGSFSLISTIIAIIRYDIKKENPKEKIAE